MSYFYPYLGSTPTAGPRPATGAEAGDAAGDRAARQGP